MTIGSVVAATFFLLQLVGGGWRRVRVGERGGGAALVLAVLIVLLVLALATVARPALAPITGIVYALGQGALIGSISKIYETCYEGIVFLTLTATIAVFVGALLLYVFPDHRGDQEDLVGDRHRHLRDRALLSGHLDPVHFQGGCPPCDRRGNRGTGVQHPRRDPTPP